MEIRGRDGKKIFGATNVQVFSFYCPARYLLQQTALPIGDELSELGSAVILRQILERNKEELIIFYGEINRRGFTRQLRELYNELRIGDIQLEDLTLLSGDLPNAEGQQPKMRDLKLIFSAYDSKLTQRAPINEDALSILADYMQTRDFNSVKFIVSGFSRIDGQEYQLLQVMTEKRRLVVDLLLDRPYAADLPEAPTFFHGTGEFYLRPFQSVRERRAPILVDRFVPEQTRPTEL